jgi:hypothetical protein
MAQDDELSEIRGALRDLIDAHAQVDAGNEVETDHVGALLVSLLKQEQAEAILEHQAKVIIQLVGIIDALVGDLADARDEPEEDVRRQLLDAIASTDSGDGDGDQATDSKGNEDDESSDSNDADGDQSDDSGDDGDGDGDQAADSNDGDGDQRSGSEKA